VLLEPADDAALSAEQSQAVSNAERIRGATGEQVIQRNRSETADGLHVMGAGSKPPIQLHEGSDPDEFERIRGAASFIMMLAFAAHCLRASQSQSVCRPE
jgi:hypothetical protein